MKFSARITASVLVVLVMLAASVWWWQNDRQPPAAQGDPAIIDASDGAGGEIAADGDRGSIVVGGIRRPISDTSRLDTDRVGNETPSNHGELDGSPSYGTIKPVAIDANPQVALVAQKIRSRGEAPQEYAKAVSLLAKTESFDLQSYQRNPAYRQGYLQAVQPGRAFKVAEPAEGVERLQSYSPSLQSVRQGEVVRLSVIGVPATPYTFTSLDLGTFVGNSLTSITVEANKRGVASVEFFAGSGTIGEANILVGGPATSGQARFLVEVQEPS